MRATLAGSPGSIGRGFGRKVGKLLNRSRLGLVVFFFTLACGGTSESVQSDPRDSITAESRADVGDPIQLAASNQRWVLPPVSAGPKSSKSRSAPEIDPELRSKLSWALLEYRSAFVGRDLKKLQSIWSMGAVERLLIKSAWSSCEKIELSLETVSMRVTGRSAVVDFDQELTFLCPNESRTSHSTLSAELERSDGGHWSISKIGDRHKQGLVRTANVGPAHLAPRSEKLAGHAATTRALETLSDYESALQRCDLDGLARVWIMTELERQILEGLCFRRGQLDVTISEPRVSTHGGEVSVDFIHDLTRQSRAGPMQTRSRLTALLIEREDGNWAIWKVRSAE